LTDDQLENLKECKLSQSNVYSPHIPWKEEYYQYNSAWAWPELTQQFDLGHNEARFDQVLSVE